MDNSSPVRKATTKNQAIKNTRFDYQESKATPIKKRNNYMDSSRSKSSGEEIDGNSFIKQYYLERYGSAKKGFNPVKQLQKKELSQKRAEVTPQKKYDFYRRSSAKKESSDSDRDNRFKSPQGDMLVRKKQLHQSQQKSSGTKQYIGAVLQSKLNFDGDEIPNTVSKFKMPPRKKVP